jgi:hypothetical protein
MKRRRILTTLGPVIVGGLVLAASATIATASATKKSRHDEVVTFWTKERVAKAKPRDFVLDPVSRRLIAEAKRPATTDVTGASWSGDGDVAATTGRVFFSLGTSYYLCSGSVVQEAEADRSIVLTAAHCAYDEENGSFAENWMFVPDYDAMPTRPTVDASFCADTARGCWTAEALVVAEGYATAGEFNNQAVVHDYAYAVVGAGGNGSTQLDATVGAQAVRFDGALSGTDSWLFGFPAAGRYKGNDLTYCRGSLGFDPWVDNQTYRVKCDMTGGSSGGPWFAPFSAIDGAGSIMSVNSYGYQGIKAMYGPRFGSEASAMFDMALAADADTVYGSG